MNKRKGSGYDSDKSVGRVGLTLLSLKASFLV